MNFSKYKFVDECKDKFDSILELFDLDSDKAEFKNNFFAQVGVRTLSEMFKTLSPENQAKVKPLFENNNELAVINEFISLFSESQMENMYKESFRNLLASMFNSPEFDSIQPKIKLIMEDTGSASIEDNINSPN